MMFVRLHISVKAVVLNKVNEGLNRIYAYHADTMGDHSSSLYLREIYLTSFMFSPPSGESWGKLGLADLHARHKQTRM
jgi:hypothetical protein